MSKYNNMFVKMFPSVFKLRNPEWKGKIHHNRNITNTSLCFCVFRWGWGAPVSGLVHSHTRKTPFSTARSRAGLHVSIRLQPGSDFKGPYQCNYTSFPLSPHFLSSPSAALSIKPQKKRGKKSFISKNLSMWKFRDECFSLQSEAAEPGREASWCGVWAEMSSQQTRCVWS